MRSSKGAGGSVLRGRERRRFQRFPVFDRLLGILLAEDLPIRIRDVSLGGFAAETPEPLPADVQQAVHFIAADDWSVEVEARSIYCRPSVGNQGNPLYVTGFSFVGFENEAKEPIAELVEKVTSVRMPEEE